MLKKIKSLYFIKNLFEYIEEIKKLKLIKYNKSLQKIINVSVNNYIHLTGKYIIYESNGAGKEYFGYDNLLIYKGGIINGQRNGKGKEYNYFGQIIFEGKFLNGQRNGKGKEYDWIGKLKFEGEYLNGKAFIGNKYDRVGNIEYQ